MSSSEHFGKNVPKGTKIGFQMGTEELIYLYI